MAQLKVRLQTRFAESVEGHIELWQARYRRANEQEGEFWVSLDGKKIYGLSTGARLELQGRLVHAYRAEHPDSSWADAYRYARPIVEASGEMLLEDVNLALFRSLNSNVDECLRHELPSVRGIAMLDERLGKRRLPLQQEPDEHAFVFLTSASVSLRLGTDRSCLL